MTGIRAWRGATTPPCFTTRVPGSTTGTWMVSATPWPCEQSRTWSRRRILETVREAAACSSSRTEYYWNIYNLLGDPSLSTYLAPTANAVTHPATVFVGTPSLALVAGERQRVRVVDPGRLGLDGEMAAEQLVRRLLSAEARVDQATSV